MIFITSLSSESTGLNYTILNKEVTQGDQTAWLAFDIPVN